MRKYGLQVIILALVLSCNQHNKKDNRSEKIKIQQGYIKGKKLMELETIVGDSICLPDKAILLYTGYDCGTCVKVGFDVAKQINVIKQSTFITIIECQSNKGQDQINYNYQDYIFTDKNDLIRKQLKYVKTPILLFFDSQMKIIEVYQPSSNDVVTTAFVNSIIGGKE